MKNICAISCGLHSFWWEISSLLLLSIYFVSSFLKLGRDVFCCGFLWDYPVWDLFSFLNLKTYIFCQIWEVSIISNVSFLLVLASINCLLLSVWDPSGSWYDEWFFIGTGHLGYYVRRLWVLLSLFLLPSCDTIPAGKGGCCLITATWWVKFPTQPPLTSEGEKTLLQVYSLVPGGSLAPPGPQ